MKNRFFHETSIAVALLALLALLLNPFHFWMPGPAAMMLTAGVVVVFGIFAALIWRENGGDERERVHRMFAGRTAFLAGAGVLVAGIVFQSYSHALDPWLPVTLGVMVAAKVLGRVYSSERL